MKTPATFTGLGTKVDTKSGDVCVTFTFKSMESPAGASLVMEQFVKLTGMEVILKVERRQLSLIPDGETVDPMTGEVKS